MKIRLIDAKPVIARVLALCATDARVTDYINRACQRLLYMGNWTGTVVHYRICANNGCITWPREIETIISYALCNSPGIVRSEWYEFLDTGVGLQNSTTCAGNQLVDRGQAVAFDDVIGTGKKLRVVSDVTEAASSFIILRFYNQHGEYVRSVQDGEWSDGEKLTGFVAGVAQTTTNFCMAGGLVEVIKSPTLGMVRLYEYDTVSNTVRPLAYYAPSEEVPIYRRSLIPGLSNDTTYRTVDVMAKRRYLPVANDNDVLLIQHLDAIRLATQAIAKEEKDLSQDAVGYWALAKKALDDQLGNYQGAGITTPIRMVAPQLFGAGGIGHLQ